MNTSSDPSSSPTQPTQPTKKPSSLYPPEPAHNPSIAPPFSNPSFESMSSTLQPTLSSEQDAAAAAATSSSPPPPQRPHLSSEYSSNHPFSPFYSHPTTRTSLEQAISASKLNVHVYEHDLESQSRIITTTTTGSQHPSPPDPESNFGPPTTTTNDDVEKQQNSNNNNKNKQPKRISTMWASIPRCAAHLSSLHHQPNHQHHHHHHTSHRRHNIAGTIRGSRACAPYRRLTGRQKWVLQILLAVLVVGAATGLGIGISKAVGAGVWESDNSTRPIGGGGGGRV